MAIGLVERQNCPLCDAQSTRILCEVPYQEQRLKAFLESFYQGRIPLKRFNNETYRVVICNRCEFIYQDKILDHKGMQALYLDWVDHATSLQKKQSAQYSLYRQYAGQIETLSKILTLPPGQCRILDYGMGWGYWSRMAQAHGYSVVGYELSAQRSAHARSMGIEVIEQLPDEGDQYHYIHANQVFEHLPDPRQTLCDLGARLTPDGVVYIRVPDGRGIVNWLGQRGWSPELGAIHPFEHINCFTRKTLIYLAACAELEPFNPPVRLNWGSLWGGIKREVVDRYLTTHLYFRR